MPLAAMQYVDGSNGSVVGGAHTWPALQPEPVGATVAAQRRTSAPHAGGTTWLPASGMQLPPMGDEAPIVTWVPPHVPRARVVQLDPMGWFGVPQLCVQLPSLK